MDAYYYYYPSSSSSTNLVVHTLYIHTTLCMYGTINKHNVGLQQQMNCEQVPIIGVKHGKNSWDRNIYRALIGQNVYRTREICCSIKPCKSCHKATSVRISHNSQDTIMFIFNRTYRTVKRRKQHVCLMW
jgi:hypothetical protein